MPIDAKHEDLSSLRIDRTARTGGEGEPPVWAQRYILIGIAALVLLGIVAISYRLLSHDAPEVETVRASAQSSDVGGVVLSASGYIVAHHKINLNSKETGRVKWIGVEKGELVTSGFASTAEGGPQGLVVSLADLNDLQVELDIAQDDFARLNPKQKGVVTTDAFPDRRYDGVIAEMSPQANRAKATVQVKVQILAPDSYLRPDMNATVKFLADEGKQVSSQPQGVFVPTSAVRDRDGKKIVFLSFDGKATAREVKILSQRSGGVLVQGLNGGEDVITTGPADLKDGEKIKIKGQS